jgi:Zn-dependent protease/predicted transcriptional regulator
MARLGETEIRIHITFLLLLLWIAVAYYVRGGMHAAIEGVVFIIALFACVVLHEFGHVLAARTYGISTPDITLLPIGGVARLQRMPDEPGQELVVALAGPAVNVVIALGLFLGLRGAARLYGPAQLDSPAIGLLAKLLSVNIWLVLFNLIPAFPMDGGRVFRALLAMRMSYARATRIAAAAGQAIAFAFAFIGLFYNPLLIFIALFIYLGAAQEAAFAEMKEAARGLPVADVMMTEFRTLPLTATLNDAVEALLRTSQHEFPIVDEREQTVGLLTRDEMIGALRERGPDTPVSEVMRRDVPIMRASRGFDEAFRFLNESHSPAILVTDGTGKVVGMLTAENVGELMMVKSAMGGNGKSKPRGVGPSHLPPAVAAT